mmetsp:Transcript_15858/g.40336  ORF Transcript_15858/g.40336 Transcript_15858/m.40336 type:complete len:103 (-) Transcript_15858:198-506(-)
MNTRILGGTNIVVVHSSFADTDCLGAQKKSRDLASMDPITSTLKRLHKRLSMSMFAYSPPAGPAHQFPIAALWMLCKQFRVAFSWDVRRRPTPLMALGDTLP